MTINILNAQNSDSDDYRFNLFGIGVGFQTAQLDLYNWISASNLIFTFNFRDYFRVEPEFGDSKY